MTALLLTAEAAERLLLEALAAVRECRWADAEEASAAASTAVHELASREVYRHAHGLDEVAS